MFTVTAAANDTGTLYYIAVMRKNSLPRRLSKQMILGLDTSYGSNSGSDSSSGLVSDSDSSLGLGSCSCSGSDSNLSSGSGSNSSPCPCPNSEYSSEYNSKSYSSFSLYTDLEANKQINKNITSFPGRDENECIIICPLKSLSSTGFKRLIMNCMEHKSASYYTAVIDNSPVTCAQIREAARMACRCVDSNLVIGITTLHYINVNIVKVSQNTCIVDDICKKIKLLTQTINLDAIKDELKIIINEFYTNKYTQLNAENLIRQFFCPILKLNISSSETEAFEYILEDAFSCALSYYDLFDRLCAILNNLTKNNIAKFAKMDTPQFFETLRQYIISSLHEPLSLQSICKDFGVSQSYLSKLFRKYKNQSFNEFLTSARMEYAKKLLLENRKFCIKDIAIMVGYIDPFYFSRVFHCFTGMPPSEYSSTMLCTS